MICDNYYDWLILIHMVCLIPYTVYVASGGSGIAGLWDMKNYILFSITGSEFRKRIKTAYAIFSWDSSKSKLREKHFL